MWVYPCGKRRPVDEPTGYLDWHNWVARKGKTHRQSKCPTCGLFHIWKPKAADPASLPSASEEK